MAGLTGAQVAIAWLISKDPVPIPGTRRIAHLEVNWGANTLVLDAAAIAELEEAFPVGSTVGERFPTPRAHSPSQLKAYPSLRATS
ncbi:MAG: aldo/keto reductase [Sphingomonadales bacterium]|nr:aldo/keto reductase [Sphingomonadales bacterium]